MTRNLRSFHKRFASVSSLVKAMFTSRRSRGPRRVVRSTRRREANILGMFEPLQRREMMAVAPVANADAYSLLHDRAFTPFVGVLQNDVYADRSLLTAQLVAPAQQGTVTLQPNGQFTFVPRAGFQGTDQFSYVASAAGATSAPATVTLTVTNTAPVAQADSFTINRDVFDSVTQNASRLLANDNDPDGDSLTASLVTAPSRGTLVVNPDGSWRYTRDPADLGWFGTVTASYRVSDGIAQSAPATITFEVTSPFSAATNLGDVPVAGVESQGPLATSLLTGEAVVTAAAGGQTLVYSSLAADARPVISVETTFSNPLGPFGSSAPDRIEAQLTFNNVVGPTVYYSTSTLGNNDPLRFALQADASDLATGLYGYRVRLVAFYGTQKATRDFTGTAAVVNRRDSEFGAGWSLAGVDRLVSVSAGAASANGGQLLVRGTGAALFFERTSPTGTGFTSPAGPLAFHTLVQAAAGFTLTAPTGEKQEFDTAGQLLKNVDLNGNTTTLAYSSGRLATITDPFGRLTTLTYDGSGKLASVTDFAGRVTTLNREVGTGRLVSVSTPDPDGTGGPLVPLVTAYAYDAGRRISSVTLPGNQVTQLTYAFSGRLAKITRPDGSTRQFSPRQTAGLVDLAVKGNSIANPAPLYREGLPPTDMIDEFNRTTRVRVDRFGNEIFRQTPLGLVTQTVRDGHGRPLEVIAPDPDGSGPLASSRTQFVYDRGNLVRITAADGGVWSFVYHATLNRPTSQTDPRGNVTNFGYDTKGNLTSETDPLGFTTRYDYTTRGQLWKITQPNPDPLQTTAGPVTTFTYFTAGVANGLLQQITYPTAKTRKFTYDAAGNLSTDTDELNRRTTYIYDALGRRTSTRLPDPVSVTATTGPLSQVVYNDIGLVSQTIDPLNQVTQYAYDPARNWLLQVTSPDPDGANGPRVAPVVSFTYDVAGRRLTQTDPLGAVTAWQYDADSRVTMVTLPDPDGVGGDPAPQQTTEYDQAGRVIATIDPLGRATRYAYDPLGRVVTETSPLGNVTSWTYDRAGNLVAQTLPDPDGAGPQTAPVWSYGFDALNRVVTQTDPRGNVTRMDYDRLGRMVQLTQPDPDGAGSQAAPVWKWGYNSRGWVTSATDPLGFVTQYTLDDAGQVTKVTEPKPDPLQTTTGPVTTYVYDLLGRVTSVTAPAPAGKTTYTYDAASRLTSVTDARSATTNYDYDALGLLIRQTEATPVSGGAASTRPVTSFAYDAAGRLVSQTDPINATTSWTRDRLGRVIATSDPLGRISTSTYDVGSQLVAAADPLGNRTQFIYDADGRQTQVVLPDPDGAGPATSPTRRAAYDNLGRTIQTTDERGGQTNFTYDASGNLVSLRDPGGNTTTWAYDGLDRQISETNALGASRSWGYSARGELTSQTDRNGRQINWAYDALGRLKTETWLAGGATANTLNYGWYDARWLRTASDKFSAYSYTYLATGEVATVSNSGTPGVPVVVLTNGYDLLGRRTEMKATVGGAADFRTNYRYNARGDVTQITQQQQTTTRQVAPQRIDFAYNAAGERTGVTRSADLAGTRVVATTTAQYDLAGRLTEWKHVRNGAGAEINRYVWTYDALGRPVTQSSVDGPATFQYDAASQVTGATHTSQANEAYQYDGNGNRTNAGTATGTNNQLLSDDRYDYEYDAEGNRTRRTERATGKYEVLAWDHRNRLTSVTTFSATGSTKLAAVEYAYDVFDRRIAKQVDRNGDGVFEGTQRFVYDGQDLILAFSGATNALTNRYVYGPATDEILADERVTALTAPGTVTWSLGDNLGTIRDLVQYNATTGVTTVVNHVRYDTFGQIVGQSDSAFQPWFAFTGREWDADVGLYFYRARWYDPRAGRFVSEDPMGFAAGDVNLSRYVGNGPTYATDPSGLVIDVVFDGASILVGLGSLGVNLWEGNYRDALVDVGGIGIDVVGAAVPFIPAGAGISIKAGRTGAKIAKGLDTAADVADAAKKAADAADAAKKVADAADAAKKAADAADAAKKTADATDAAKKTAGAAAEAQAKAKELAEAARKTVNAPVKGIDDLLRAGAQPDKNGFTRAGRALQKHGDRVGSKFPKSVGDLAARNAQGQSILEEIVRSGQQRTRPNRFGGIDVFDLGTGRGARFDALGNFIGFLD